MDNRFGAKDFFLFLMVAVLIVIVGMAMVQYDRQWKQLAQINEELKNQTRDLTNLRQMIAEGGVRMGGPTTGPTTGGVSQQSRLREVTALPDYSTGDWLVQAVASPPTRLTPLLDADLFGSRIQELIFDTLAIRDPDTLGFIPSAATSWEQSPDGLTLTFHLRPDIVFSDGTRMTADDVVYTFETAMNPEVEAERTRVYIQYVDKVAKVDDRTVRITFKQFYFQNFEAVSTLPIISKAFYSQFTPREYNESVGLALGSGPYRLADPKNWKYEPGKPFELVRNERHWGVPGPFDRIIWNMQPDPGARLIAFKNGETDRLGAQPEQYRDLLKDQALVDRTKNFVYVAPDDGYMYIGWYQESNGKPTPFKDKRVRQAMTMLIDREAIVREVLLGYARVATGPFDPNGRQSDASIKPWPFDAAKARELLREAGYEDRDGDGIVETTDRTQLKFKLSYPASSSIAERICLNVKDTMRVGGVLCETDAVEWSVLLERIRQKQVEAQLSGWGGSVESDLYQIFHSSGIAGQGDNRVSYSNPDLDKLIEQARTAVDEGERNKLWQRCHQILHEDQPYTFLFNDDNLLFVDGRFQNVKTNKLGVNASREWFVPSAKQKWGK